MVTVTVTAKFHNPSLSRRKEWQRATRLYRDTKQFCINGWENGNFDKSVTTASIDNDLYSAIQNQAIREAKSDHSKDGAVRYQESQPFAINNQNWELDTTESGTVVVGFPCVSQWWYTPIEVYDDIDDHVDRLVEGNAKKTRLQVYRRGDDWYCTFNIEYDTDTSGETPIGVDIGERHILAATAYDEDESMLVSGGEAKYVRRKYRSLRDSLSEAGALRARNRVGDKEQRRINDLKIINSPVVSSRSRNSSRIPSFGWRTSKVSARTVRGRVSIRGISTNSNSSSPTKPNALVFVSRKLTLIIPASNVRRAVQWEPVMATNFRVRSAVVDATPT